MEFDAKRFIKEKAKEIKERAAGKKALVATSGGVDSMTCAVLTHKALKDGVVAVFLDDGLMREGEGEAIRSILKQQGLELKIADVKEEFFKALKGIIDPEQKRKAFRDTFYRTLGRQVKENQAEVLVQGTIAADIQETKAGIKTQHNVLEQIGIDPNEYGLQVLEPLRDIYKPEVREVARELGLPTEVSERMPFPGPGLATRIIGEVTPERVEIAKKTNKIVEEEIKNLKPFQAFAVLMNDKATGVVNGKRAFGDIVALRFVDSEDAMTASVTRVPWEVLDRIQKRITREVPSVVKVLFDITPKPPSTIEYI